MTRLQTAAFALVLRAYPRAFRRRFGEEMRIAFSHRPSWRQLASMVVDGAGERCAAVGLTLRAPAHVRHLYEPSGRHAMFWDLLLADVRHTLRMSARMPLHTALAVLALGLGIGANTAIFTVVNRVLLRPLPYAAAGELVMLWSNDTNSKKPRNPISPADFLDFQRDARSLLQIEGCFSFVTNNRLTIDGQSEVVAAEAVTPGLFALLGREAAIGRTMAPHDFSTAIVLSDGYWRRRFGADPRSVGRSVDVGGSPYTIAGVMPADFVFPYKGMLGPTGFTRTLNVDVWLPLDVNAPQTASQRNVRYLSAVGRLVPGISVAQANGAVAAIADRLEQRYPNSNREWKASVMPLHDQVVGDVRPALLLLAAGVALVLVMACANVANLVLARSAARRKELAMRAALGATPVRLALQAFTESALLGAGGAMVAVLFAWWGVQALVALAPGNLPRLHEVRPDMTILGVSVAIGIAAGILVGVAPAIVAGRSDVRGALQEAGRGTSPSRHSLRSGLVVAEIALALVLTVAAGLLLRSFVKLLEVDPGFRVDHVLTLQMNIPDRLTTGDQRRAFYDAFFQRIEALPGVLSTGGTTRIPLGSTNTSTSVEVEGHAVAVGERPSVEFRRAMRNYFATMGIPVVRGRGFDASDTPTSPPVIVINEAMARRVFPGEDPIGRHVRIGPGSSGPWSTVVGIVGDVRHSRLDVDPEPELYITAVQNPPVAPFVVIRTAGDPAVLSDQVRAEARAFDPSLTLYDLRTLESIRAESVAEQRFLMLLLGVFGGLALVLATVGVYGVTSLDVTERTPEVGVRLALGAPPARVLSMIVRDAVRLAVIGVVIGIAAALAVAPLIGSQLFGVRPIDPLTFTVTPALLVASAAVAALVPAWRAMRIDPIQAIGAQ
jgi:putative ABC transport system permease protein